MSSKPTIIPWRCLQDATPEQIAPKSNQIKNKTFAQAINNVCDIPMSQLPKTSVKGNHHAISIPEDEYELGMDNCKFNLHARIIWPKGSTPLTTYALREKLKAVWKSFSRWGISFIGKGYYELCFSSIEDARRARSLGSMNLNPGLMKFFAWTRDFSPSTQVNSSAQVWLRIYGLPQEYWRPKILFAIASSAGSPICTDVNTGKSMFDRTFGLFARVLIDIDLEKERLYRVLVERKGFAMFVDLDYEQIPEFCTSCRMIGHQISNCRKLARNDSITDEHLQENTKNKGKAKEKDAYKNHEVVNVEKEVIDLDKAVNEQDPLKVNNNPGTSKWVEKDNGAAHATVDSRVHVIEKITNAADLHNEADGIEQHNAFDGLDQDSDAVEDERSEASEFVDDTQVNDEVRSPTHNVPTPVRLQNDMLFLNKSWDNLDDHEADGDISGSNTQKEKEIDDALLREDKKNLEASGFQLVTSRTKKRTLARSNSKTRTTPSNPKPSQ